MEGQSTLDLHPGVPRAEVEKVQRVSWLGLRRKRRDRPEQHRQGQGRGAQDASQTLRTLAA